jgi:hypothetical protein
MILASTKLQCHRDFVKLTANPNILIWVLHSQLTLLEPNKNTWHIYIQIELKQTCQYMNVCIMLRCHLHVLFKNKGYTSPTTTSIEKGGNEKIEKLTRTARGRAEIQVQSQHVMSVY